MWNRGLSLSSAIEQATHARALPLKTPRSVIFPQRGQVFLVRNASSVLPIWFVSPRLSLPLCAGGVLVAVLSSLGAEASPKVHHSSGSVFIDVVAVEAASPAESLVAERLDYFTHGMGSPVANLSMNFYNLSPSQCI